MKKLPELTRRERDVLVAPCRPLARGAVFTELASIREVADTLEAGNGVVGHALVAVDGRGALAFPFLLQGRP
jgi:hypothetical protein